MNHWCKGVSLKLLLHDNRQPRFLPGLMLFVVLLSTGCVCGRSACTDQHAGQDAASSELRGSSLSYQGHENGPDSDNLVNAYPHLAGTRLDDCQACHTSGVIEETKKSGETSSLILNPCSYCHLIPFPDDDVQSGAPDDYEQTLNPYGRAYLSHGRDQAAVSTIASFDSDGDGFTNEVELADLRYPGDATSKPGQQTVPVKIIDESDLSALVDHKQLMLMNAQSKREDYYGLYEGVIVKNLLASLGLTLTEHQSVTFIAPDGYAIDFPAERINHPFPAGVWYPDLGPDDFEVSGQGFVFYPPDSLLPGNLVAGVSIPGEQWIMLALHRDGRPLKPTVLKTSVGKISGEGPYRSLIPQGWLGVPGPPDRNWRFSSVKYNDGHDFNYDNDHNSGLCVRGLVAIRINPLPAGYEEFDWKNGGFAYVARKQLIIYGAGITGH